MLRGIGAPPPYARNLFGSLHYKFSSQSANRPSTFYFADQLGNRGRFRRAHQQGADLVYQGRCKRVFVSPALAAKVTALALIATGDGDDEEFNETRYGKLAAIIPILEAGDPHGIYRGQASLIPHAGWHVFDTNGDLTHFSAGQITMQDNSATQFFQNGGNLALFNYNGPWTVW